MNSSFPPGKWIAKKENYKVVVTPIINRICHIGVTYSWLSRYARASGQGSLVDLTVPCVSCSRSAICLLLKGKTSLNKGDNGGRSGNLRTSKISISRTLLYHAFLPFCFTDQITAPTPASAFLRLLVRDPLHLGFVRARKNIRED